MLLNQLLSDTLHCAGIPNIVGFHNDSMNGAYLLGFKTIIVIDVRREKLYPDITSGTATSK
jgi:hypothetical protein